MLRGYAVVLAGLVAVWAPPAGAQAPAGTAPDTAEAALTGNDGQRIGTVKLVGSPHLTLVEITIEPNRIPPGWHGAHFHAVGDCSDPAQFAASKAHINHGGKKHGLLNPDGPDEGDLPNVYAGPDGSVHAQLVTPNLLGGPGGLRDADGSALLIHANADDYVSQPIGGAGARIACAAFK